MLRSGSIELPAAVVANGDFALAGDTCGDSLAPGVIVTGVLAEGAAYTRVPGFCGVTGQTLTCHLNAIRGGKQKAFTMKVKPAARGTLNFTARVAGEMADPNPGNNAAAVAVAVK